MQTIRTYIFVIKALILRDIRSRYFGHGIGYVVTLLWPLTHILAVISMFSYGNRAVPYGESSIVFVATGTVPFMVFSYLARFMMLSVLAARPLLSFPELKLMDVMISSAIFEVLTSFVVIIILILLAMIFDVNYLPRDLVDACFALCAAVLMGVGFGIFNGIIAMAMPLWATVYFLSGILLWLTSGIFFIGHSLPEPLRTIASYHPTLQLVEWMRASYYDGYGEGMLDRYYVIKFSVIMICGGLIIERLVRGFILSRK